MCSNLHVPGIAARYLVSFDPILKMKETFLTSHVPTPWPGFMSLAAPTFLFLIGLKYAKTEAWGKDSRA